MKRKLLPKFVASLGILGLILTIIISIFSYRNSKTYLENMYAERVITGSKSIADMLDVQDVKDIIAKDGDKSEAYKRVSAMFDTLKSDGEITYLSLVVPDEDSVTFYIDSCVPAMGDKPEDRIPYGSDILYTDAASDEKDLQKYRSIWDKYAQNKGIDEPLVTDNSYGFNYTAVSPVLDENGKAIAEIQYILDMNEVRNHLNSFLYTMLAIAATIVVVAMLAYILFVRQAVIIPIGKLAAFTKNITETRQFKNQRVEVKTKDEIAELGSSFNFMMEELENYIENLSRVTSEKERIGAELDVATRIQASMLPCIFPAFPERSEFEVYATMNPAKEVGGDFYDFFMVDEDNLAIVMADVSGKGVPAALFMVIGKTLIKDHTEPNKDLGEVFSEVNSILCESNSEELFITAFEGVLNLKTGEFRYVNAGHEIPFICKKGGVFEPYKIRAGFVLAGMDGIRYKAGSLQLEPGDKLFQYTDGVTEATDKNNKLYGMDRLEKTLSSLSNNTPTRILQGVKADIDEFVGDAPQFDDITMLCLEYRGNDNLSVNADVSLDELPRLTEFVENTLNANGVSQKTVIKMNIALDEIFSNIVKFSGATYAKISCGVEKGMAYLRFEDDGIEYDPLKKQDADITLGAEEREIGGLGIFMVKKSMDSMEYEYTDSKNILLLKKSVEG